jgi:diketogulonate reductase-like aldo/keto reductase
MSSQTPPTPWVKANGAAIPAIGLGTWNLRGEECTVAVNWALEAGYRHVDTAAMYGNEDAVGLALKRAGLPRDEIFVTSKVWYTDLAPEDLERSTRRSLDQLELNQLDLLLIHWLNPAIPLKDTLDALSGMKRHGLTRHIGVSNFSARRLDNAVAMSQEPLVVNQCEYHPYLEQRVVREACRRHGLAFTSYCPLGRGEVIENPTIGAIARRHGKTPAQIVLRWHVQQPGTIVIPKSGNRTRIRENLAVFDFGLTDDEMARISALARPEGRKVVPSWAVFSEDAA